MGLLGFAFAITFVPYLAEASNAPKWIIASVLVPWMLAGRRIEMTTAHWLVLAFLAWCAISLFWAVSLFDGVNQLWKFIVLAGVFALGSCVDIRPALKWFVFGIVINGVVAALQHEGILQSLSVAGHAGLLLQKNYLAEAGLVAAVIAFTLNRWLSGSLSLVVLAISASKAAWFAGGMMGAYWVWRRHRLLGAATALLVAAGSVGVLTLWIDQHGFWDRSPGARVAMTANTAVAIADRPLGHGVGSFWSGYPLYHDRVIETGPGAYGLVMRPRTPHSDLLTIGFELGIPGLAFLFMLVWQLRRHEYSAVILSFILLGLFAFPLFVPSTALIVALVAGRICGDRQRIRGFARIRRTDVPAGA